MVFMKRWGIVSGSDGMTSPNLRSIFHTLNPLGISLLRVVSLLCLLKFLFVVLPSASMPLKLPLSFICRSVWASAHKDVRARHNMSIILFI